jgi:hypothetical protein
MLMSGTPCPIGGMIGDAAYNQWLKTHPEKFIKLYGFVPPLVELKPTTDSKEQ